MQKHICFLVVYLSSIAIVSADCILPPTAAGWPIQINNWNWSGKIKVNNQNITITDDWGEIIGHYKADSMLTQCVNGTGQIMFSLSDIGENTRIKLENWGSGWKSTVNWLGIDYSRTQ